MDEVELSYKSIGVGVLVYLTVSNLLWLLFGSRILQSLPGVGMEGWRGTIKIAVFVIVALVSAFEFLLRWPFYLGKNLELKAIINRNITLAYKASRAFTKS